MPIKGLTDRESITPRFPSLGKLRKGAEKPDKGPGKELPYFRFTSENNSIVEAFTAAYGDKPMALHIYLPHTTAEENFSTWQEEWVAGGLKHRCDGETAHIWLKDDGAYSREPIPCPGGCKAVGRLELILPELLVAGFVGYVTLETHSNHDLRNITAALLATETARKDTGLQGIKFTLRRKKESISTPTDDGKRVSRDKWLVYLEPEPEWVTLQLQLASAVQTMLPAPEQYVDDDTGEIIDADVTEVPERPQAAPQPKAQPQPKGNGNGAKTERPASAKAVRKMLHNLANETFAKFDGVEPTDAHRGFLNGKLKEAGQDDQKRKLFLRYVFDAESSSELDKAQWLAIGRWLVEEKPDSSGETAFREYAVAEFEDVVRQAQIEQGQADMFDAPAEHEHALPAEA